MRRCLLSAKLQDIPLLDSAAAAGLIASSDSLSHQATPSQTSKVDTIFCLGITLNTRKLAKKIGEVKNNCELAQVGVVRFLNSTK